MQRIWQFLTLILYLFPAVSIHCHHSEGYRGEGDRAPIDAAFFMENQGVSSSGCKDISLTHSLSLFLSLLLFVLLSLSQSLSLS